MQVYFNQPVGMGRPWLHVKQTDGFEFDLNTAKILKIEDLRND